MPKYIIKKVFAAAAIAAMILLSSCAVKYITPTSTTIEAFDTSEALEMVRQLEKPIVDLITEKTWLTRDEIKSLQDEHALFAYDNTNLLKAMLSVDEYVNLTLDTVPLTGDVFVPTVFHQGIDVVDAYVEKIEYEEEYYESNRTTLYINTEYTGKTDELFEEFYKQYVFKWEDGWVFDSVSGVCNYAESGLTWYYLPLKK